MVKEFEPIKIFLSYDDKDESLKDNLTKHLSILKNQGHITIWNHSNIQAGEETTQAGNKNLNEADIILLLMSSDFIASDYYDTEMKEALKRHETENTRVIPILLRPFHLSDELFNNLKVLPDNGKPVTQWTSEDGAFANIVQNIKEVVNNLIKDQLLKKGKALYEKGEFQCALTAFEQAIRLDPQCDDAHFWKGKVFNMLEQPTKALAAYDQAIRLNPKNPEYYIQKSNLYWHFGKHQEALESLDQAIHLNSENAEYCFLKATHLVTLKQYEDALVYSKSAMRLDPLNASYFAQAGDLFEKLDHNEKALEVINQAIKLDPSNIDYHMQKSNLHWYLDQYGEALATIDAVIKLDSQNAKYYILKTDRLLHLSIKEEKLRTDNPNSSLSHIRFLLKVGDDSDFREKALKAINQAIKLDPRNAEYYTRKGQTLFSLNRYDEALTVYDQLLNLEVPTTLRKHAFQSKIKIYNLLLQRTRNQAKSYGIQL